MPVWLGSHSGGPAMTEYIVKEIGHQWIVYADRLSIAACADEASALKLIAEDSAANSATRKSTVHDIGASKNPPARTAGSAVPAMTSHRPGGIRRRIGNGAIKLRGCRSEQFRRLTRRCGRDLNKWCSINDR
jgi:hypothetical protein